MKRFNTGIFKQEEEDSAVSELLEYIIITGILLLFLVIFIPMVNSLFIEGPTKQLTTYAFTDIGNGVSTRIIDLYAIIPYYNIAEIVTKFDIPDDVAGRDYFVKIEPGPPQYIVISGSGISSSISLSGIGETVFGGSEGNTTARGLNYIRYKYPPDEG